VAKSSITKTTPHNISELLQDVDIFTTDHQQEVIYGLSNSGNSGDLESPSMTFRALKETGMQ